MYNFIWFKISRHLDSNLTLIGNYFVWMSLMLIIKLIKMMISIEDTIL